jgi:3-oxoacid CoA-transferase
VHLPGIYVDKVVLGERYEKRIANLTVSGGPAKTKKKNADVRERIAARAAKELQGNIYANLGVGIPTLIPSFLGPDSQVILQSENGLLGMVSFDSHGYTRPNSYRALIPHLKTWTPI